MSFPYFFIFHAVKVHLGLSPREPKQFCKALSHHFTVCAVLYYLSDTLIYCMYMPATVCPEVIVLKLFLRVLCGADHNMLFSCLCLRAARVHRSSVSPSKATLSGSMWMCEFSSLHTQPMGVRLNDGRERMSACRLGSGSGSSGATLISGISKVSILDALS